MIEFFFYFRYKTGFMDVDPNQHVGLHVFGIAGYFLIFIKCCSMVAAVVGNGLVVASILSRKKTREKKNSMLLK